MSKVLAVALRQLASVGYERLSIPEVAAEAGVNKTSVYRRWPGKPELVRDALAASVEQAHEVPDTGGLRGDLIQLARRTAHFVQSTQGKGLLRVLFAEGALPEIRKQVRAMVQQSGHEALHLVFQRARERGELGYDFDADLVLFTLAGALMHRAFIEKRKIDAGHLGRLVDLVLHGVVKH